MDLPVFDQAPGCSTEYSTGPEELLLTGGFGDACVVWTRFENGFPHFQPSFPQFFVDKPVESVKNFSLAV